MIDASKETLLFAVYANQWGSRLVSRRLRCAHRGPVLAPPSLSLVSSALFLALVV